MATVGMAYGHSHHFGIIVYVLPIAKIPSLPTFAAPPPHTPLAGDPHMTGFRGQKFDFTGEDGRWYSVLSDRQPNNIHLNMRVTSPVKGLPEITYITGIGIKTVDADGRDHTILVTVDDPYSLDSACPVGVSPCLADGALTVELDGEIALLSPGEVVLGPQVAVSAANLPGACRYAQVPESALAMTQTWRYVLGPFSGAGVFASNSFAKRIAEACLVFWVCRSSKNVSIPCF